MPFFAWKKRQSIYLDRKGGSIMPENTLADLLAHDVDYATVLSAVRLIVETYPFVSFSYLTESVMGKGIPLLRFGEGEKEIYYIGTHHGAERITAAVLLRFAAELCARYTAGLPVYGLDLGYLFRTRTLYVLPMLNVDGADIAANGAPRDSLWFARLVTMNGSEDFTHWQANARGVDLNHNYDAGFAAYKPIEAELGITGGAPSRFAGEHPESEPETGALVNFLRFNRPTALMSLHTQGREIYGSVETSAARRLAALTGYTLATPAGAAAYGGLADYCIGTLGIPAFTLECGKGQNPLPHRQLSLLYAELREALFAFPTLF